MITTIDSNTWRIGKTRLLWKDMPVTQHNSPQHRVDELLQMFGLTGRDYEIPEIMLMINLCLHSCPDEGSLDEYFTELLQRKEIPYAGMRFLRRCIGECIPDGSGISQKLLTLIKSAGYDDLNFNANVLREFILTHPGDLLRTDVISCRESYTYKHTEFYPSREFYFNIARSNDTLEVDVEPLIITQHIMSEMRISIINNSTIPYLSPLEKYAYKLLEDNDIYATLSYMEMCKAVNDSKMNRIDKAFCYSILVGTANPCNEDVQLCDIVVTDCHTIWSDIEHEQVLNIIGEYTGIRNWDTYYGLVHFIRYYLGLNDLTDDEFESMNIILCKRRYPTQLYKDRYAAWSWDYYKVADSRTRIRRFDGTTDMLDIISSRNISKVLQDTVGKVSYISSAVEVIFNMSIVYPELYSKLYDIMKISRGVYLTHDEIQKAKRIVGYGTGIVDKDKLNTLYKCVLQIYELRELFQNNLHNNLYCVD